jgi:hypothetical protein
MLHHHKLLTEGTLTDGVVLQSEPSSIDGEMKLIIGVVFDDGSETRFEHRHRDYYEPPAHLLKGLDLMEKRPVIPLWFTTGDKIPVRYDPKDHSKLAIDEPTLESNALDRYVTSKKSQIAAAEATMRQQRPGF